MVELAIPALYALAVWWLGTGIVLTVVRRRPETYRPSIIVGLSIALAALVAIAVMAKQTTPFSAYVGFTAAIAVWGFIELTFLTGMITGPNRSGAPASCFGAGRVRAAVAAVIHHELALVAGGLAILIAAHGEIGATAVITYAVLWVMRLSAKLNLFLGVPNLHDELLPAPIAHLRSHFRRGPMSPLLPVSILVSLSGAAWLAWLAAASTDAATTTAFALLAALLLLAALEHIFMLIPVPLMNMWNWGGRRPDSGRDSDISINRRGL